MYLYEYLVFKHIGDNLHGSEDGLGDLPTTVKRARLYVYIYVNEDIHRYNIYVQIYIKTSAHTHIHMLVQKYLCTYIHTYINIHTYIHIYIYMNKYI
jgi:hypothetical protein